MMKARDIDIFEPRLCVMTCALILLDHGIIHVCRLPRGHTGAHTCNCGATWEEVDQQ